MSKVYYEGWYAVEPLTAKEQRWIESLQRVLARCPDRLELVTIGDAELLVVDRDGARASAIRDGAATRDGIVLARVPGKPKVHGVSA